MLLSLETNEKYTVIGIAINSQFSLLTVGLKACKTPILGLSVSLIKINSSYAFLAFCDLQIDASLNAFSAYHRRHHRHHRHHRRRRHLSTSSFDGV